MRGSGLWRRRFGTVSIEDPRPAAQQARYTYFLPSENELLAIAVGDLVKVIVQSHPSSSKWDAERMWFSVTEVDGSTLTATLDNDPFDIPQLHPGDALSFPLSSVIDIAWDEGRSVPPPPQPPRRTFWDRCLVDRCVLDDGARVHFLYREEPDAVRTQDEYPDSGWRIRGDYRNVTDTELASREAKYVALGAVLNRDDTWLAVIDAAIGSRFVRDWDRDVFVPDVET